MRGNRPSGVGRRRPPPLPQGCSVLCLGQAVGEEAVEAEGVDVVRLAHVADAAGAQDVEREGAQPGEGAGLAPDAAVVLAQEAIAHVVVPVLDAPVRPDRPPEGRGVQPDLAGVEGDLLVPGPQPGAGVLAPGQARDPGRAGDPRPPVRVEAAVHLEHLDAPVLLAAVPAAVDRLEPVGGLPLGAQGGQGVAQAGLVALHPRQQGVAAPGRGGEAVFWQCSASAVRSAPVRPSSATSAGAAGTSSGTLGTSRWARISAASLAKALSTWAAAPSCRWSKLRRRVLPSRAMTGRPGRGAASCSPRAWRRKAVSRSTGSRARNRLRSVFTAGARRRRGPEGGVRGPPGTPMKLRKPREGGAPASTARTENRSRWASG